MQESVTINGRLIPAETATVSVYDSGFMLGVGLFETFRSYDGRPFRTRRHLQRLIRSAQTLGWSVLPDLQALEHDVEQVIRACGPGDARVRLTVTTGSLHASPEQPPQLTVVASAAPAERYPPELYARGVTLALSKYRQNPTDPTTGHKTTSYFARLASLREAHATGAFEALWLTLDELVAEAAMSSVFAVLDEVLVTPPLDTPVLPGITRAAVLELAGELEIPTREQTLTLTELLGADEVFLTSSMAEIVPVVRIERQPIANEQVGELTRRLAVAYGELIDRERDEAGT